MVDHFKHSSAEFTKFLSGLHVSADSNQSFSVSTFLYSFEILRFIPMLLTSVLWSVVSFTGLVFASIANSIAILICYFYFKNYRRHTLIIVDGYIILVKTFAEFLGAAICVCYGLLEMDPYHTTLGLVSILTGLGLKALLLHQQNRPGDQLIVLATYMASAFYACILFVSGLAFHKIVIKTGLLPCATKLTTCVVPLVALTDRFVMDGGPMGTVLSRTTDAAIVLALWWFCGHVSLKYFVVVPSVLGLLFAFIQYLMVEIQKMASEEVVSDLYAR